MLTLSLSAGYESAGFVRISVVQERTQWEGDVQKRTQHGGDRQPLCTCLGEGRSAPHHCCRPYLLYLQLQNQHHRSPLKCMPRGPPSKRKHDASHKCCLNIPSHVVLADGSLAGQRRQRLCGVLRAHWPVCSLAEAKQVRASALQKTYCTAPGAQCVPELLVLAPPYSLCAAMLASKSGSSGMWPHHGRAEGWAATSYGGNMTSKGQLIEASSEDSATASCHQH